MAKVNLSGKLVDKTVELIIEKGTSMTINMREVTRRTGCNHTNVYNYFKTFNDLKWAAFHRVMGMYRDILIRDLDKQKNQYAYLKQVLTNLIDFGLENPGLYRFIASDPLELREVPENILDMVSKLKLFFYEVISMVCGSKTVTRQVMLTGDILLSYLDGIILNTINGRILPQDVGRLDDASQAIHLFCALTAKSHDGISEKDMKKEKVSTGHHNKIKTI